MEFTLDYCAARVRNAIPSEVRKIYGLSQRPGIISFASGMPELGLLPLDTVAEIAGTLLRERTSTVLQYGASSGTEHLRGEILKVMRLEGIEDAAPENIVVTAGSQSGIDLVARTLCDPGDVVLVEAPSYAGAMAAFSGFEAEIVHVPIDGEGLIPAELQKKLDELTGRTVKFLYTIPNFHNPSGTTLGKARRAEVLGICREAGIMVVEDNPYGLLDFEGRTERALRADDPNVLYLGSFSKIFAPGFRVGWLLAPPALSSPLALGNEAAVLNASVFNQELIATYLSTYDWQSVLDEYRAMYGERAKALMAGLKENMPPGVTWTEPDGGFYCWLTLPDGVDSYELALACIERGLVFVPGSAFYSDGRGQSELRISFSHPGVEKIGKGTRILGDTLKEFLQEAA